MVIKSKKWRTIVSFGAFFLGVSLLLCHGIPLGSRIWKKGGTEGLLEQDYQNTAQFQSYMESQLSHFTALATGGTTGWYDGSYYGAVGWYDSYYSWENGYAWAEETIVATDYGSAEAGTAVDSGDLETADTVDAAETKQRQQRIQEFLKYIGQDKNLLYQVYYDGEELYSNMEDLNWSGKTKALREGYNFYMRFANGEVTIQKDGKELDIYGDGVYREGEDWYVPGYKNFTVDKETKKAEVILYAAEEPVSYSSVSYGADSYRQLESGLYEIAQDVRGQRQKTQENMAGLVVGIICMVVYFILRREKKEADRFLGAVTGKVWLEGKVLVVGLAIILLCSYMAQYYWYYGSGIFTEITYELSHGQEISSYLMGMAGKEFLECVAAKPGLFAAVFWLLYLCVNDIRQNRRTFWQGGISRFVRAVRTRNLNLEFSKRMVRRFLSVFLVSTCIIVLEFLLILPNGALERLLLRSPAVVVVPLFLVFALFLLVCGKYLSGTKQQAKELDLLAEQIQAIHDGDYSGMGGLPESSELKVLSDNLAEIRQGMENAIEERMKSERMKVELVANVSHDIKTPLTSIISYVQFLKQEEDLPEHVKDYIHILDEKSERLNAMVQDVFAVSKAASGQLPVNIEELDFAKLLRQTLADMAERIAQSPVTMRVEIPEHEVKIQADGGRMYRVFQNLIQNALQYSLEGSRVYLTLTEEASVAVVSIKNTSCQELGGDKDFTERFVRGDESRTDGGSGLGLSIAKSFTEACKGQFEVGTIADLFVVTVSFPRLQNNVPKLQNDKEDKEEKSE